MVSVGDIVKVVKVDDQSEINKLDQLNRIARIGMVGIVNRLTHEHAVVKFDYISQIIKQVNLEVI